MTTTPGASRSDPYSAKALDALDNRGKEKIVRWFKAKGWTVLGPGKAPVPLHRFVLSGDGLPPEEPTTTGAVTVTVTVPDFVWRLASLGTVTRLSQTLVHHGRDRRLKRALEGGALQEGQAAMLRERYEELQREALDAITQMERFTATGGAATA